eukprot:TRINITY_DN21611_c0_g1_i2.p1 TRINITY_DN21611_c0_g1~~TRINITY_DN21611_c0_g1_i2.p1  ORF type:complete len:586 (+),score=71.33 TRINITY_DN21611_c0_g1_i2:104-1861(+)
MSTRRHSRSSLSVCDTVYPPSLEDAQRDRDRSLGKTYGATGPSPSLPMPRSCYSILVLSFCESMTWTTISRLQPPFLEHLGVSLALAGRMTSSSFTIMSSLAIPTSWLADVLVGRYFIILISSLVYVFGAALAAYAAMPHNPSKWLYFVATFGVMPPSAASIEVSLMNLGADQYGSGSRAQMEAQEKFFSYAYLCSNAGNFVACAFFTTLGSSGGLSVPQEWGYTVAQGAMAISMLIALGNFHCQGPYKVAPLLERSGLGMIRRVLREAAGAGEWQAHMLMCGLLLVVLSVGLCICSSILGDRDTLLNFLHLPCILFSVMFIVVPCLRPTWVNVDGTYSDEKRDVQSFLSLLPSLISGTFAIDALYNCCAVWYLQQACMMDLRVSTSLYQLSGSFFDLADTLAIIIFTPLAVMYVFPMMHSRAFIRYRAKFCVGMFFAVASVLLAATLEKTRKFAPVLPVLSSCAAPGTKMSGMTSSWMFMPYFLMGLAEIFTKPTLCHVAYSRSPPSMRLLAMATLLSISSISSAVYSSLVAILAPILPDNLNDGNLEYAYYISVVYAFVALVLFLFSPLGIGADHGASSSSFD